MKKSYHLTIKGKVQGVYYRDSMRQQAQHLNIRGWVKNLINGDVSAVVTGEEDSLKKLIKWCKIGPKSARVEKIESEEISEQDFADFDIRY